jgi:hypothetical protein
MLKLSMRPGSKPATHYDIPHQQLDQIPSPAIYARLVDRFLQVPQTSHGPSLISVPGAQALFLNCEGPHHPAAFLRGSEFAHVHPASDGSFHMILSAQDCSHVLERGWGELHPLAAAGKIHPTVIMIYAPRDEDEIDVVLSIVAASKRNAQSVLLEGGAS